MQLEKRLKILHFLSALGFGLICVMLPMVGPAGVLTSFYGRNQLAFFSVLVIFLGLAGYAQWLLKSNSEAALPKSALLLTRIWLVTFGLIFVLYAIGMLKK